MGVGLGGVKALLVFWCTDSVEIQQRLPLCEWVCAKGLSLSRCAMFSRCGEDTSQFLPRRHEALRVLKQARYGSSDKSRNRCFSIIVLFSFRIQKARAT